MAFVPEFDGAPRWTVRQPKGHQRFGRAQQTQQMVADVPAAPTLAEHRGGQDAQAKGIVQLG